LPENEKNADAQKIKAMHMISMLARAPKLLTLKNLSELSKKSLKSTWFNNVLRLKEITD
jgi:hypothetical protein